MKNSLSRIWYITRNVANIPFVYPQGVLKVRKRVTLMVVIVSLIFGISWGTSSVFYVLKHFTAFNIGNVAITNTMALFNSSVNPFVYALLNQQFREKVKRMICCTLRSINIQPMMETQGIESANSIAQSNREDHNWRRWQNEISDESAWNVIFLRHESDRAWALLDDGVSWVILWVCISFV